MASSQEKANTSLEKRIKSLELEIEAIKRRNKRVEKDKAWETSYTRRVLITLFTYFAMAIYLAYIRIPDPWLNAVVPAVAFILSTLTLPWFKKLWVRYVYRN